MKNTAEFFANLTEILDAAPDALVIINHQGIIVHVNQQTEELFGYAHAELLGQHVEQLIPERYKQQHVQHRNEYFNSPCNRAMGAGLNLYGLKKDNTEFSVEISLNAITVDGGTFTLSSIRDITYRRNLEQVLEDKNIELELASQAKDNFLSSMSHELRTPLNAIIGFTGIMSMRLAGPITPDQEKQLNTIRRSANHLLSLINDLLDLAKIEAGKVDLCMRDVICQSVIEEISSTMNLQVQQKYLNLILKLPGQPLSIKTDKRALTQILINLLNNAIKYTEKGSIIVELLLNNTPRDAVVVINIIDTGVGIHAQDLCKIFNSFERVKHGSHQEGTGLGLHISQKLAGLLGGYITCTSERGQGSTFSLSIPTHKANHGCTHSSH